MERPSKTVLTSRSEFANVAKDSFHELQPSHLKRIKTDIKAERPKKLGSVAVKAKRSAFNDVANLRRGVLAAGTHEMKLLSSASVAQGK